jgi:uncharacterized protein YjbJ (UPF0337 family)
MATSSVSGARLRYALDSRESETRGSLRNRFTNGGIIMNWLQIEGKWDRMRGKVKEKWGRLTDDQLDIIAGKRDQMIGALKETYGMEKEIAEREIDVWASTLNS